MMGDGINATIGGVLRGAGRQELGALLNLGSYWFVGLPTAYLLSSKAGLELRGLWGGLVTCTSLQGVIMLAVLLRFNWQREAARSVELQAASGCVASCSSGNDGSAEGEGGGLDGCEDSAAKLFAERPRSGRFAGHGGTDASSPAQAV